jgi:hypothetical protein
MTYNLDLFPSKPGSDGDWLLQFGEAPDLQDTDHINVVIEAIEQLSPQSKFCIEAIFYERIPFSQLGERLGVSKPHAWRLSNKAIEELKQILSTNKVLNERYNMFSSWNEAITATLTSMETFSDKRKVNISELKKYEISLAGFVHDLIYPEAAELDMGDLGRLAVSHLKSVNSWDKDEMVALLCKKQADYGHQNILRFGLIGLSVRLCDKIARLNTLEKRGAKPQNESVLDTWMDIVGYSAISKMLNNGTFNLELENDNG